MLKKLYKISDIKELNALFSKRILKPVIYNAITYRNAIIFKFRIVREIKNKNTPFFYKKFRLII